MSFEPGSDPEGAHHPPLGPKLNTQPFPTWVEVRLEAAAGRPGRTRVRFAFIAEGARIEAVPGGPYEWYFSMQAPEGERGGEGNTVLAVDPPRSISFEWNAPPSLPNVRKQRHVVQVDLTPEREGATRVVVTALGFGTSEEWRATHAYFEKAWATVLDRLQAHFAQ